MKDQMTFKRYELKYMLTIEQYMTILNAMTDHMIEDAHGRSTIQSLYFDTPDYLLIRRSIEKPMYKEKLRLRSYGLANADTKVFLELKKKYDSVVYKRRISMTEMDAMEYFQNTHRYPSSEYSIANSIVNPQIKQEIDYARELYNSLAPRVHLSYERDAYYAADDPNFRITFDQNILWRDFDLDLHSGIYGNPILPKGHILMEIKTAGGIPMWLTRVLSANKIYKTSFSKYGTAYKTILARDGKIREYAYNYNMNMRGVFNYA